MPGRRVNWPDVRAAYVQGHVVDPQRDPFQRSYPTMDEVATVHGIGLTSVRRHAAAERWTELREDFQAEVEGERRRWLIDNRTRTATGIDTRGLQSAEAGLALIGMRLTRLINDQTAKPAEARGGGLDARELAGLGLAAKRFIDVKAHVMGQPSTAPEDSLDELERAARVEERKIAEELAAFIEERRAEQEADGLPAGPTLAT